MAGFVLCCSAQHYWLRIFKRQNLNLTQMIFGWYFRLRDAVIKIHYTKPIYLMKTYVYLCCRHYFQLNAWRRCGGMLYRLRGWPYRFWRSSDIFNHLKKKLFQTKLKITFINRDARETNVHEHPGPGPGCVFWLYCFEYWDPGFSLLCIILLDFRWKL